MPFRLYADRDYLSGTPEAEWTFVGNDGILTGSPQQCALESVGGRDRYSFLADHVEIQAALTAAGAGIALLPDFIAQPNERLAAVRPDAVPLVREIWVVFHSDMKASAPIRAIVDCLRDGL